MGEWIKLYNGILYRLRSIFVGFVEKNACDSDTPWCARLYRLGFDGVYEFPTKEEAKAFVETTAAIVLGE